MQSAIVTRDLTKRYGSVIALDGVSLTVERGEIFGFLGPNGAGKSTFVKILLHLVKPTAGDASLFGVPVHEPRARKNVGYLPEHIRIYDFLTVAEFIRLHVRLAGIEHDAVRKEAEHCFEVLGIASLRTRKIGTLSKGMLQRVGLAQAIIGQPELLILDEPTTALDPIGFADVRRLLLDMRRCGTTIFLNSHILSEVERTCDRIAILNHGSIVAIGRPGDIAKKDHYLEIIADGITDEMLAQITSKLKISIGRDGSVLRAYPQREQDAAALHSMIAMLGGRVRSIRWHSETLEDLFCRIVHHETVDHQRNRD
ncbi:MAG: ABC transporter ATP-binding protein [Desulfobacterota bacterium]|nr:ABC transporter ATP-binding protein [Thermodesulfobacteriota bacterium]